VNRLIGSFPADQQSQVRAMLSESLRAVLSQRLLARADGAGLVPAIETMVVTKAVGNLIREMRGDGRCVLFSTHVMHEAARLCDHVAVIHRGRLLAHGTPHELTIGYEDLEAAFAAAVAQVDG